jgi:phenylacetate-CoA ligase
MKNHSILENVIITKMSFAKPNAVKNYSEALSTQFYSDERLNEIQEQKTIRLIRFAYENVPFYREKYDKNSINVYDLKNQKDIELVPLITKDEIRQNFQNFFAGNVNKKYGKFITTGGSTGQPLKVYHDNRYVTSALMWRMYKWWNLPLNSSIATVYRETNLTLKQKLIDYSRWWPSRHLNIDASALTETDIINFIQRFNKIKPKLLHGYVGSVLTIAQYILDNKLTIFSPSAIWVTSAPLSKNVDMIIQKAFGSNVYDQYGCCEVFYLASECSRKEGLHIFSDVRRIDIVNEDGTKCPDGQNGNILVTDLENYFFPLIKYANGDTGRKLDQKCSCGVALPLLDKVKGRVTDMIKLPDGTSISGDFMTTIFDDFPDAVKQFQLYQQKDKSIILKIVQRSDNPGSNTDIEKVMKRLYDATRNSVNIQLLKVPEIENTITSAIKCCLK